MACYSAVADFVDSNEKRQMIDLLRTHDKAIPATSVMQKLLFASQLDSIRVPRQIAEDLYNGMTVEEVAAKPYKYKVEIFYYTQPEYVPKNDPHWSSISLIHANDKITIELPSVDDKGIDEAI